MTSNLHKRPGRANSRTAVVDREGTHGLEPGSRSDFPSSNQAYLAALELEKRPGGRNEARAAMQALVDDADAQFWLAKDLLRSIEVGEFDADSNMPEVRRFLERSVVLRKGSAEPTRLLLAIYRRERATFEAEQLIKSSLELLPELRLALATLYEETGRSDEARREAALAAGYFQKESARTGLADAWLRYMSAMVILDDEEKLFAALAEGERKFPKDQRFRQQLIGYRIRQYQEAFAETPMDVNAVMDRFEDLIHLAPKDPEVVSQLAFLLGREEVRSQVHALLKAIVAQPAAPSVAFELMGIQAGDQENYEDAVIFFEKALALNPTSLPTKNHLAFCLSQTPQPQLDRALILINEVFDGNAKQSPVLSPTYLETRGQILVKCNRMEEAVPDLLQALRFMPAGAKRKSHAALAKAYAALGDKVRAAAFQGLALSPDGGDTEP